MSQTLSRRTRETYLIPQTTVGNIIDASTPPPGPQQVRHTVEHEAKAPDTKARTAMEQLRHSVEQEASQAATVNCDCLKFLATDIPPLLQLGIPPPLHMHQSTTYWGTAHHLIGTPYKEERRAIGLAIGRFAQAVSEGHDLTTDELISAAQGEAPQKPTHLDARRTFQLLRGQNTTSTLVLPQPCQQAPPSNINIYTDGTLLNPTTQDFCLGGAAVWHPDRTDERVTEAEADAAVIGISDKGISLQTHLAGYGGSSTRMEPAAGIQALGSQHPAHIGTDSAAFMQKAIRVHGLIEAHQPPRRPWLLQRDGDLWQAYWQHAKAKGTHAIRYTKVKGHATVAMVEAGTVATADKQGNDEADKLAKEATELFGEGILRLGRKYGQRQKSYSALVFCIQRHLVLMYKARAQLLAEHEQQNPPPAPPHLASHQRGNHKWTQVHLPSHRLQAAAHHSHNTSHRLMCRKHITVATMMFKHQPDAKNILQFLQQVRVIPLTEPKHHTQPTQGRTWLELFIIYHLLGHPRLGGRDKQHKHLAQPQDSLGQLLQAFRLQVRRLVKIIYPPHIQRLFNGKAGGQPLMHLGITTHLTTLPLELNLRPEVEQEIAIRVLQSQASSTLKAATAKLHFQQWVHQKKLRIKGRCRWVKGLHQWPPPGIYNETEVLSFFWCTHCERCSLAVAAFRVLLACDCRTRMAISCSTSGRRLSSSGSVVRWVVMPRCFSGWPLAFPLKSRWMCGG